MRPKAHLRVALVALLSLMPGLGILACAQSSCGDFLAILHKKDSHLEFLGCKRRADLQGQPEEASYRVEGRRAAEVEDSLTKEFGIERLHRTCCVWESMQNSFRDKRGRIFVIAVSTDETKVDRRDHWAAISYFYVKVDRYLKAP
jgi:hypothetical protein